MGIAIIQIFFEFFIFCLLTCLRNWYCFFTLVYTIAKTCRRDIHRVDKNAGFAEFHCFWTLCIYFMIWEIHYRNCIGEIINWHWKWACKRFGSKNLQNVWKGMRNRSRKENIWSRNVWKSLVYLSCFFMCRSKTCIKSMKKWWFYSTNPKKRSHL